MLALKHWKSQEAASYSPAVTLFFFLFFFLVRAAFVLSGRCDCHSRPCTRSCASFFTQEFCVTVARARRCWRVAVAVSLGKTPTNQQRKTGCKRLQT